jgi:hypothetical protein
MNWSSFRSVDYKKLGEEITIKTMFKKKIGFEDVSIYIGNVLVKDLSLLEKLHDKKGPIPVLIKGIKKGEHVYNNIHVNDIESTRKLCWIYLNARGLELSMVNEIPPEVLRRFGVSPPAKTFKDFFNEEKERKKLLSRAA